MTSLRIPAKNLADAFAACDPAQPLPAGDERYVDLASGRGREGSCVARCRKSIQLSPTPVAQIFAGHRGCGKSTELLRLAEQLRVDGYFVAFFEVDGDLDLQDTEPSDVLLAVVRNLEEQLRENGFKLSDKLLDDFLDWFGQVVLETTERKNIEAEVRSEVGINASVPLFAKLLARFTGQVRTGTESKKNIRRKLDPQVSQLVERGRLLVSDARSRVQKAGLKDLVMIIDNLDRVALVDRGHQTSHDVLFIERGDLLKGFGCHTIVTVPISLLFSPRVAVLNGIFPDRHLLPMVKMEERGSRKPWPEGRRLMEEIVRERLDVDVLFENGVVGRLIEMSGGHPRQLMFLLRQALSYADEAPITAEAVDDAVSRLRDDYDRSTPERHWPLLAQVYDTQAVVNDDDHQVMLFNLSVLEYQNKDRWCDVQPVIRELSRFRAELAKDLKIRP